MTIFDCGGEMADYHAKHVTLSSDDQRDMHGRREAGRTRLKGDLERQGYPQPADIGVQGSYAMRTMIQDDENEYDIDDGVYFEAYDLVDGNGYPLTPRQSRERVCSALKSDQRLKHDAEVKDNCVRQEYPEGYHIDVAVYRIAAVDPNITAPCAYELASGERWLHSDARAVTRWFNGIVGELNQGQPDGSQLRRVVKLTKKLSRSRKDWKAATTSGICITVLVCDAFVPVEGRDDESFIRTLRNISTRLFTGSSIKHPILDKTLADPWDVKVKFFRDCVQNALQHLAVLETESCSRADARKAWDFAFDTDFFGAQPDGDDVDDGGGKRSIFIASKSVTQRNDSGRRFG